jgi:four helix bundle protein
MDSLVKKFSDLNVYKASFVLAMEIFELTRKYPVEEKYSLTDQILRASRSVPSNIAEAYGKRNYSKQFIFSLTVSESEVNETICWLHFSERCEYISKEKCDELESRYEIILKMLAKMKSHPDKWS